MNGLPSWIFMARLLWARFNQTCANSIFLTCSTLWLHATEQMRENNLLCSPKPFCPSLAAPAPAGRGACLAGDPLRWAAPSPRHQGLVPAGPESESGARCLTSPHTCSARSLSSLSEAPPGTGLPSSRNDTFSDVNIESPVSFLVCVFPSVGATLPRPGFPGSCFGCDPSTPRALSPSLCSARSPARGGNSRPLTCEGQHAPRPVPPYSFFPFLLFFLNLAKWLLPVFPFH